jgi:hypothetical protein
MYKEKSIENILPGITYNLTELKAHTEKFPFFGLLHYCLLQKIDPSSEDYSKFAQKTALHLNNPFRLQCLISDDSTLQKIEISSTDSIDISNNENSSSDSNPNKPKVESSSNEMLFEPLHATDYFASQGIKLSEEVNENDKLSKQLKSFTAWLKTMKKVNIEKLAEQSQPLDHRVEQMAEKSNLTEEVLTESMAEVYLSQGKTQKAIETYQKLSLQNPSKSAYFADLIQKIKAK